MRCRSLYEKFNVIVGGQTHSGANSLMRRGAGALFDRSEAGLDLVNGRGYVAKDAPLLFGLGLSTAAGAVLIMVLYLIHEAFGAAFYRSPVVLWSLPAILFLWLGRLWLLVGRDEVDDDPLWFALRDNVSLGMGVAMAAAFLVAWQL